MSTWLAERPAIPAIHGVPKTRMDPLSWLFVTERMEAAQRYEDAIVALLAEVGSLDDHTITEAVRLYGEDTGRPDELTLARIEREREEASQRLAKTRDIAGWQATMARLDAEAEVARQPREGRRLAPSGVVAYLRSLPSLWADAGPEGRQALATALFAKTDVLGYQRMEYELTPDAIELGLNAALPTVLELDLVSLVGARGFEPPTSASRTLRSTKLSHAPTEGPAAHGASGGGV